MELHTLYFENVTYFSTTDYNDFSDKLESFYNEVKKDDWEEYQTIDELIEILENHAYHYQVIDANRLVDINSNYDLVNLYFKLQQYNPSINFQNGTDLLLACNRLLNYHHEASVKYVNDNEGKVSLLQEIVGNNGLDQLNFHKEFRNTYNISIY